MLSSLSLASSYVHQLDSFVIQFKDDFGVRWYGMAYAIGFVVAWLMLRWAAKHKRTPLDKNGVTDMLFASILGVLLGGRIGYAVFYKPALLIGFTDHIPYWKLLAIHDGGMSAHGGICGVIIALIIFGKRARVSPLHMLDLGAVCTLPGLCFGRIANFVNAELWGRALSDDMQASPPSWSVKYPQQMHEMSIEQLSKMTDVAEAAGINALQWQSALADSETRMINTLVDKIIALIQDGHVTTIEAIRPHLTAFYPSQIFQAITDGPILLIIMLLIWLRPRKPGIVAGSFGIAYALMRFSTEFFRQPDEGIALLAGLSRGQVLSAAMAIAGLAVVLHGMKSKAEPLGGLLPRREEAQGSH